MFGYATQILESAIEKLEKDYEVQHSKISQYDEKIKYIDSYYQTQGELKSNRFDAVFGLIFGFGILLVTLVFSNVLFAAVGTVLGIGGLLLSALSVAKINHLNKKLNTTYHDLLNISDQEISNQRKKYISRRRKYSDKMFDLDTKIRKYNADLNRVNQIKDVLENIPDDPYFMADSEEEYKMLTANDAECMDHWNGYLAEKSSISDIHFDSSIDLNSDSNKKMIKKM